ncbi:MAG: hypothetical protein IPI07_04140 [Flavobacteriales bacterium]|nr:hypothetical protein [Flavobacteriales bacterium]
MDRLRALSYQHRDYLHNKPDSGYLLAVMQYDLAAKVGNERYQGLALNTQGEYFGMKGDFPRMLNCFERSEVLRARAGHRGARQDHWAIWACCSNS